MRTIKYAAILLVGFLLKEIIEDVTGDLISWRLFLVLLIIVKTGNSPSV